MTTIRSEKFNTTITYSGQPYEGKEVTRDWTGPGDDGKQERSLSGVTWNDVTRETVALKKDNVTYGHDWRIDRT